MERHRCDKTAFTRQRKLTFPNLILHGLNLLKGASQQELDNTFEQLQPQALPVRQVTKSAYTQARSKFSHQAFIEINRQFVDHFYQQPEYRTWHGFRLCAIDGSQLRLPHEAAIIESFGLRHGKANQQAVPMALASLYYDVLNQVVIDAQLCPSDTAERTCVAAHLEQARVGDLVLFDRGYPAFWLYALLASKQLAFCMRAKTKLDLNIKAFLQGGKKQAIVTFSPNRHAQCSCQENGLPVDPVRLRLIRVELGSQTEVLMTNLLDDQAYPADDFAALYHQRWLIEEQYKRQKQWLQIENFSGKSVESIRQDFYAKQVSHNLTSLLAAGAQAQVDVRHQERKLRYKINFAQALSGMKNHVIHLLREVNIQPLVLALLDRFSQNIEACRPDRQFIRRVSNLHQNLFFVAYKACR